MIGKGGARIVKTQSQLLGDSEGSRRKAVGLLADLPIEAARYYVDQHAEDPKAGI